MGEEKKEHTELMKHRIVRGVESLAVLSIVLVPVVRRMRARHTRKHRFERRHFPIFTH
jgi:hypothetical protein